MALISLLFLAAPVAFILSGTTHSFLKRGVKTQRTTSRTLLYDDDDGHATGLSQNDYRDRPQKLATLILVLVGFSVAFASAVRATKVSNGDEDESFVVLSCWVRVASWLFLSAQCSIFFLQRPFVESFRFGLLVAFSVAALLMNLTRESYDLLTLYQQLKGSQNFSPRPWIVTGSEIAAQIMIGILAVGVSLSVPRRPAVFYNGHDVDAYLTVSALQRFTFSWARPTFLRARSCLQFELGDLPVVGYVTRAKNLQNRFNSSQKSGHERLWKVIYRLHRQAFAQVAILTVLQSIFAYAPHLCLYRILRLLELQQEKGMSSLNLWFWAIALGCAVLTQHVLEVRLEWTSVTLLKFAIRSQLSAVIFRKTMRMKDVKFGRKSAKTDVKTSSSNLRPSNELEADDTTDENGLLLPNAEKESPTSRAAKAPPGPEKSDQAVINLISIDAARVADFCCRSYVLVSSLSMLCVAIVALVRLLGWVSLGAGLMTVVLLSPANYVVSKAYANAQVALMKYRDDRAAITTDALLGIRQIKFSATEPWWQQQIMAIRVSELRQQRWVFVWIIALRLYWIISPILLSIASLTAFSWIHGSLSASVAFTAVGVFGSLEMALSSMPFAVSQLLETLISCKRIEQHIWEFESPRYLIPGETVEFENATVKWPTRQSKYEDCADFMLRDVSASFPRGKFCLVHGRSGCGKTLLLNSIVGEADLLSGKIYAPKPPRMWESSSIRATASNWIVPSSFAYVAQVPWLENATIRDNITFGLLYDGARYERVVNAAAMQDDLNALEQGDMTEIGSQGITLSGGQRCRIALAKALYSRAEILVMDDIFSAVDARVGRHILDEGLLGELCKDRTIILATHHVSLCLPKADHAIEIYDNGYVRDTTFNRSSDLKMTTVDRLKGNVQVTIPGHDLSVPRNPLVEGEFRESGVVKWPVYDRYIRSSGGWLVWMLAFGVIVASQLAMLGRGWWMNLWTRWSNEQRSSSHGPTAHHLDEGQRQHDMNFYLACYALISLSAALLEAVKCAIVYIAALRASRQLFERLISSVLRSRLRWLDVTPLGRILNRLTSDFVLIDTRIPGDTHTLCSALLALVATSVAGLSVTWYMIIPEVFLSALSLAYAAKYLRAARELQRLDSVLKSPILSLFSSSLVGRSTIRAYGKAEVYTHLMFDHLDNLSRAGWSFSVVSCWTSLRLGVVGALFAVAVAITVVIRDIDASLAGFALGFSLDLTKKLDNAIARYASLQLNMNSTERVVEFCDTETENFTGNNAPKTWPPEGRIFINSLSVRYAPRLPDAIKGLSLMIAPREHIGVVGRTGAGKSSLSLAMFRLLEARSGSITVDGIDISTIKLDQLRSRMAIIPQDPILFSGTIRSNLDPTNQYSESLLRDSLHRVHLLRAPPGDGPAEIEKRSAEESSLFGDLDMRISEGGSNLSQGQRQLLCLARAIINQCKIMVVDEATSAVDMHTDALIQNSIKEQFHQSTLIVIAHRLSTVADFDKILVMAEGEVAEFDSPRNLLKKKGEFYRLVEASGEKEKVQAIISCQPTGKSHSSAI